MVSFEKKSYYFTLAQSAGNYSFFFSFKIKQNNESNLMHENFYEQYTLNCSHDTMLYFIVVVLLLFPNDILALGSV